MIRNGRIEAFDRNRSADLDTDLYQATGAVERNHGSFGRDRHILETGVVAFNKFAVNEDQMNVLRELLHLKLRSAGIERHHP